MANNDTSSKGIGHCGRFNETCILRTHYVYLCIHPTDTTRIPSIHQTHSRQVFGTSSHTSPSVGLKSKKQGAPKWASSGEVEMFVLLCKLQAELVLNSSPVWPRHRCCYMKKCRRPNSASSSRHDLSPSSIQVVLISRVVLRSGKFLPLRSPGSPLEMYSRTKGLGRLGALP